MRKLPTQFPENRQSDSIKTRPGDLSSSAVRFMCDRWGMSPAAPIPGRGEAMPAFFRKERWWTIWPAFWN